MVARHLPYGTNSAAEWNSAWTLERDSPRIALLHAGVCSRHGARLVARERQGRDVIHVDLAVTIRQRCRAIRAYQTTPTVTNRQRAAP